MQDGCDTNKERRHHDAFIYFLFYFKLIKRADLYPSAKGIVGGPYFLKACIFALKKYIPVARPGVEIN
jgi:hypothetical protein